MTERKQLTTEELQAKVAALIVDAARHTDEDLSPFRAQATKYYRGDRFGNEEEGRSQVVLTEVRDSVAAVLPQILRVVFGAERPVEFSPRGPEDEEQAQQATDYVFHVFAEENAGFMRSMAVIKDGLIRRLGVFKYGWVKGEQPEQHKVEGIDEEQLLLLAADDEIELTTIHGPYDRVLDDGSVAVLFDVEYLRRKDDGCAKVWELPPEEFIFHREARSLEDAVFVAHRTYKTRGELIAMGIDPKVLDEHAGVDSAEIEDNEEFIERHEATAAADFDGERPDPSLDKVLYVEGYALLDFDGDGIAERRRICTIGNNYYPVVNEPWPDPPPFAIYTPDPEPHSMVGLGWADRTMDIQLVKSAILRATLDSLAQSIFPRTAYVEGQVAVEDILNTEIGAPIRMRAPGMVQPFEHNFKGREAFPVLTYMDDVVERRTGQNRGAAGLDANALQSTTKAAVGAAVSASQAQVEMLVRVFCEQTLKPLIRGLLRLIVKHQPRARMVRLRGRWVNVDPRVWNADMDVSVNVAFGTGLVEDRIAALAAIAAKQEQAISVLGPQNPLVTLAQYRHTLAMMTALSGFKDASKFWLEVDPNWQPPAPDPSAQQMSPEMVFAQIEQQKAMAELEVKREELRLKELEIQLRNDRERDKAAAELELKRMELMLKHRADIERQQLWTDIAATREAVMADPAVPSPAPEGAPDAL